MKRGVWVGSLLLSLAGWTSDLRAEEPLQPEPSGPVSTILAPAELLPSPVATIGRPTVIPDEPNCPPLPVLPTSGWQPVSYQLPAFPPGSAAPDARDIPNGDQLPTWEDVDEEKVKLPNKGNFATDRQQFLPPPLPAPPPGLQLPTSLPPTLQLPTSLPPAPPPAGNASGVKQPTGNTTMAVKQTSGNTAAATNDGNAIAVPNGSVQAFYEWSATGWPSSLPTMLPPASPDVPGNPFPYPYPLNSAGSQRPHYGDAPDQLSPLSPHFYVSAEYLLWWTKKDSTPPLVTTSTDSGFGFLNDPTTRVLFGGDYGGELQSGFRANAGLWLDTWCEEAIEVGGFFLGGRNTSFSANSNQFPVLARPFFDVNSGQQFSELVAFPGISTGHITVSAPSNFWGLDTNLRCNVCTTCDYRFDVLAGFRYLNLGEGLGITEVVQGGPNAPAPFTNSTTVVNDSFDTRNQFYGGQIGFSSEWKRGPWSVDMFGKVALGGTVQNLNINGSEAITAPNGVTTTFPGGLLALSSNIGNYNRTVFSVVPEVGLTLGYQITNNIRVYGGYNFLYWTNVVRPGEQINTNLDVTRIPNFAAPGTVPASSPTPTALFKESDFWAQGFVVGIEFRY
jgi:hypothetical protein